MARFLIRVNLMDSVYSQEVARTNRIGVGLVGVHEWAWMRWGLGFRDLLDEHGRAREFWSAIAVLGQEAKHEAKVYSLLLSRTRPFTTTTAKPAGSVGKLFNLTEGVHLPARRGYLRWVQFKGELLSEGLDAARLESWALGADPLIPEFISQGYPWRTLKTFPGMTIIGFPTRPTITTLGMGNRLVTAPEATPVEQYQWLRLLERYWLGKRGGNQLSYTLKIYTDRYSLDDYREVVLANQPTVRCCSILPSRPDHELGYEYLPEEILEESALSAIETKVEKSLAEGLDLESLRCESGVCPL